MFFNFLFPRLPSRTGVGVRFFESPVLSTLLKEMKKKLQATASYHQENSTCDGDTDSDGDTGNKKKLQYSKEFHGLLSG